MMNDEWWKMNDDDENDEWLVMNDEWLIMNNEWLMMNDKW